MAAVTLGTMLQRLHGMEDTKDLTDWENGFVKRCWRVTLGGKRTTVLSERQVESLTELFEKHFAA